MAVATPSVTEICLAAQAASRSLATTSSAAKDAALLRVADALEARARAGDAPDLDPTLASGTPHADAWRGLETLCIYVEARRGLLFERFLELWRELEREGFGPRLRYAIGERPEAPTPLSPSDNGDRASVAIASPTGSDG